MSRIKNHLPALIAAALLLVLILCSCRFTYIPDAAPQMTTDENGAPVAAAQLSVAEQYCLDNWDSKMLPTIREYAQDISVLLPQIIADLPGTGEKYAKRENGTSAYNFCLTGTVKVLGIESPEKTSKTRLLIDVAPYDGIADAKIQVSSVIKTNTLRDSVGFLKLDDFANQVEFAELTKAFNAKVQQTLLSSLDVAALDGKEITFTGCVAVMQTDDADDFLIVPIEIKAGET